jgi:quercetin dioxygenase-like cupin family protein
LSDVRDGTTCAIFSARGEGQSIRNPVGGAIEFKARAKQTAGVLTAFESAPGPGEGPPLHVHKDDNEVLYFLDGLFRLKIEDVVRNAPSGSFAFIPKGVPHTWQNISNEPGRLLVMFLPAAAGMEQFFEQFAVDLASEASVAETFATLAEVGGMKVVGPPLGRQVGD